MFNWMLEAMLFAVNGRNGESTKQLTSTKRKIIKVELKTIHAKDFDSVIQSTVEGIFVKSNNALERKRTVENFFMVRGYFVVEHNWNGGPTCQNSRRSIKIDWYVLKHFPDPISIHNLCDTCSVFGNDLYHYKESNLIEQNVANQESINNLFVDLRESFHSTIETDWNRKMTSFSLIQE
jgi:hypothetical protein